MFANAGGTFAPFPIWWQIGRNWVCGQLQAGVLEPREWLLALCGPASTLMPASGFRGAPAY